MLNDSDKSGNPCLVPDLRGNAFSFSLLSVMLAVDLSDMAFIMLSYIPSMPKAGVQPWLIQGIRRIDGIGDLFKY